MCVRGTIVKLENVWPNTNDTRTSSKQRQIKRTFGAVAYIYEAHKVMSNFGKCDISYICQALGYATKY